MHNWEKSSKILAGTGHRPPKIGEQHRTLIYEKIKTINPRIIISGMALGFDTILAECAVELSIKLIAAIPFSGQEALWDEKDKENYHNILNKKLTKSIIISPGDYSSKKYQIRNEWMVNNSDALLVAWDGSSGGTANCVNYAKNINKQLFELKV